VYFLPSTSILYEYRLRKIVPWITQGISDVIFFPWVTQGTVHIKSSHGSPMGLSAFLRQDVYANPYRLNCKKKSVKSKNSQAVKKYYSFKSLGEKSCEIKSGGQEMDNKF